MSYGKCSRTVKPFAEESIIAAKLIHQKTSDDIWLFFSGGIDSEFMVQSFLHAKIPFKIAILEFKDNFNSDDVMFAKDFCDKHGLKYYIFKLDVVKWWQESLLDYALPNQCVSPQYPVMWWLVEQVDGYPVLSLGDQVWRREVEKDNFFLHEKELVQSHYRYLINNNRPGTPGFLHYTPEQTLSYILSKSHMTMLLYGKYMEVISNQQHCVKVPIYTAHYPMKYREKNNGFENLEDLDTYWRNILHKKLPYSDSVFLSSPQDMARSLWPDEMKQIDLNARAWK